MPDTTNELIRGLVGLVVAHSAAGAKGPGLNSPVTRTYLRFNSRASTLAGRQCRPCGCTQTVIVSLYSVVDTCGLVPRLQT